MSIKESVYQHDVMKRIEKLFPGCLILKNDEQYRQGIPDLTVLYGERYALLEVKRDGRAALQPNQAYYLEQVSQMGGFAGFIYPENEEEVLDALQTAFESGR